MTTSLHIFCDLYSYSSRGSSRLIPFPIVHFYRNDTCDYGRFEPCKRPVDDHPDDVCLYSSVLSSRLSIWRNALVWLESMPIRDSDYTFYFLNNGFALSDGFCYGSYVAFYGWIYLLSNSDFQLLSRCALVLDSK